jgi:hypothetical protein
MVKTLDNETLGGPQVETEMGIVKKAFWAVACSNFIAYLSEWHFCLTFVVFSSQ